MSTMIQNIYKTHPITVRRETGYGASSMNLSIRVGESAERLYNPQDLFDALRAEGFVDQPETPLQKARKAVEALAVGTRFRFIGITVEPYVRTERGYKREGSHDNGSRLSYLNNDLITGIEVLPALLRGELIVRSLAGGTKFNVGDESFIVTEYKSAVSLKNGRVHEAIHFADKIVEVSK